MVSWNRFGTRITSYPALIHPRQPPKIEEEKWYCSTAISMVLLNRKVDYALLILCYLHHRLDGACARAIAEHLGISRPFVANILKDLNHQGFVVSQRGAKGGYLLCPDAIRRTLAELIDGLDEKVRLAECNDVQAETCCSLAATCPIRTPITEVHNRIRAVLETVKLVELFQSSPVAAEAGLLDLNRLAAHRAADLPALTESGA
jgi:Rrf2 family protein